MGNTGACACLQASGTSMMSRHGSSSSEAGSDHFKSNAAAELWGERLSSPPPRPTFLQLTKKESSSGSPPPIPAREGRAKMGALSSQLSDSPPPLPRRSTLLQYGKKEKTPPLPSRPRSEDGILIPSHRPFVKIPSSPMLVEGLDQKVKKRASGGEYLWVRPLSYQGNSAEEPPPIPPLPTKMPSSHQSDDWTFGCGSPGPESKGRNQRSEIHNTSNILYDYISIISPPEPPPRHDSLLLDLQDPDTPVSSVPSSPGSPGAHCGNGAVPKTTRLPAEAREQDDSGHTTPQEPLSLEHVPAAHTDSPPPENTATEVRRTL